MMKTSVETSVASLKKKTKTVPNTRTFRTIDNPVLTKGTYREEINSFYISKSYTWKNERSLKSNFRKSYDKSKDKTIAEYLISQMKLPEYENSSNKLHRNERILFNVLDSLFLTQIIDKFSTKAEDGLNISKLSAVDCERLCGYLLSTGFDVFMGTLLEWKHARRVSSILFRKCLFVVTGDNHDCKVCVGDGCGHSHLCCENRVKKVVEGNGWSFSKSWGSRVKCDERSPAKKSAKKERGKPARTDGATLSERLSGLGTTSSDDDESSERGDDTPSVSPTLSPKKEGAPTDSNSTSPQSPRDPKAIIELSGGSNSPSPSSTSPKPRAKPPKVPIPDEDLRAAREKLNKFQPKENGVFLQFLDDIDEDPALKCDFIEAVAFHKWEISEAIRSFTIWNNKDWETARQRIGPRELWKRVETEYERVKKSTRVRFVTNFPLPVRLPLPLFLPLLLPLNDPYDSTYTPCDSLPYPLCPFQVF